MAGIPSTSVSVNASVAWSARIHSVALSLAMILGLTACGPGETAREDGGVVPSLLGRSAEEIWPTCLLCHGGQEMQRGPILNGLPAWYVEHQLVKFQTGLRGSSKENRSAALMAAAISQIQTPTERRRVATHIESLPRPPQWVTVRGDADQGAVVYLTCQTCHGAGGEGNPSLKAPPIRLLEDWYMLDQLRKIQAGLRGGDQQDPESQSMRMAIQHFTDQDLRNVVRYVATRLSPVPQPPAPPRPGAGL